MSSAGLDEEVAAVLNEDSQLGGTPRPRPSTQGYSTAAAAFFPPNTPSLESRSTTVAGGGSGRTPSPTTAAAPTRISNTVGGGQYRGHSDRNSNVGRGGASGGSSSEHEAQLRRTIENELREGMAAQIRDTLAGMREQMEAGLRTQLETDYQDRLRKELQENADALRREGAEKARVELQAEYTSQLNTAISLATEEADHRSNKVLAKAKRAMEKEFVQKVKEVNRTADERCEQVAEEARRLCLSDMELRLKVVEDKVREEMRSEVELKMREALLARLKVSIAAELRQSLAAELRPAVRQELLSTEREALEDAALAKLRAEQQVALAAEYREQLEAAFDARVEAAREEAVDEAAAAFEERVDDEVESRLKAALVDLRKEFTAKQCEEAKAAASTESERVREEKAELGRIKSQINLRRRAEEAKARETREALAAEREEFERHKATQESKLSRRKKTLDYKEKHLKKVEEELESRAKELEEQEKRIERKLQRSPSRGRGPRSRAPSGRMASDVLGSSVAGSDGAGAVRGDYAFGRGQEAPPWAGTQNEQLQHVQPGRGSVREPPHHQGNAGSGGGSETTRASGGDYEPDTGVGWKGANDAGHRRGSSEAGAQHVRTAPSGGDAQATGEHQRGQGGMSRPHPANPQDTDTVWLSHGGNAFWVASEPREFVQQDIPRHTHQQQQRDLLRQGYEQPQHQLQRQQQQQQLQQQQYQQQQQQQQAVEQPLHANAQRQRSFSSRVQSGWGTTGPGQGGQVHSAAPGGVGEDAPGVVGGASGGSQTGSPKKWRGPLVDSIVSSAESIGEGGRGRVGSRTIDTRLPHGRAAGSAEFGAALTAARRNAGSSESSFSSHSSNSDGDSSVDISSLSMFDPAFDAQRLAARLLARVASRDADVQAASAVAAAAGLAAQHSAATAAANLDAELRQQLQSQFQPQQQAQPQPQPQPQSKRQPESQSQLDSQLAARRIAEQSQVNAQTATTTAPPQPVRSSASDSGAHTAANRNTLRQAQAAPSTKVSTKPPTRSSRGLPLSPAVVAAAGGRERYEQELAAEQEFEKATLAAAAGLGTTARTALMEVLRQWTVLEISYIRRLGFVKGLAGTRGDDATARLDSERSRLARLVPLLSDKMDLVRERESLRAQLDSLSADDSRASLTIELRRRTLDLLDVLEQWTATTKQPFLYRGLDYLAVLRTELVGGQ